MINNLIATIKNYRFEGIIFMSVFATMGSLYYSEIMGLQPCILCWYQRVFMYPIPLVLVTARLANVKSPGKYVASLAIPGLFIAAYHVLLQVFQLDNALFGNCSIATPCQQVQYAFGGIFTIATQSLISFLMICILLLTGKINTKKHLFN